MDTPVSFYRSLFGVLHSTKHFLILGDFNAHHSAWGCRRRSVAGVRLLRAVEEMDLVILNDGGTPTLLHPSPGAFSVIDLVIASPQLAPLCEVSMEADTYGSDHYPIITILGAQVCLTSRFRYRISLSKQQLQLYYHNLSTKANSLSSRNREDVLELYDSFVNDVLTEARDFLPEDKRFPRSIVWRAKRDLPP
ncbi:hypothetical protein ALC57_15634 [Trachymyrmex cornetzi]|uniref:Endonuclease/exonuclease/phosphatase domain-containing protein n=1 Tax=Trachymyrmex cornetzi TaxID=471704 RepID=A0A151IWP5_9HYME|nr:hypothetical protein ALC57_15634 [Trachymyrmex cornetzi]